MSLDSSSIDAAKVFQTDPEVMAALAGALRAFADYLAGQPSSGELDLASLVSTEWAQVQDAWTTPMASEYASAMKAFGDWCAAGYSALYDMANTLDKQSAEAQSLDHRIFDSGLS